MLSPKAQYAFTDIVNLDQHGTSRLTNVSEPELAIGIGEWHLVAEQLRVMQQGGGHVHLAFRGHPMIFRNDFLDLGADAIGYADGAFGSQFGE